MSFKEVVLAIHELNAPTYRNKKYAAQWLSSIENHVLPVLGTKNIGSISSSDILSVLSPIWSDKHNTAKKIRQRLSQIMKWAKAQGYYSGNNPVKLARMAPPKISQIDSHHAALPFTVLKKIESRWNK